MDKENTLKLTPSFDLFSKSVEKIKKNIGLYIGANLMPVIAILAVSIPAVLIYFILRYASNAISDDLVRIVNVLMIVVGIAGVLFLIVAYGAFMTVANLHFAKEKTPSFKNIWETTKPKIVDTFLAQLLAGVYILGGFLLFIIPGFFMLRRYYLTAYYVIDQDLSPTQAVKKCKEQSLKASGYVWGLLGVTLLLSLTGIVPIVGGLISGVLGLMYGVAPALRYLEIKKL